MISALLMALARNEIAGVSDVITVLCRGATYWRAGAAKLTG